MTSRNTLIVAVALIAVTAGCSAFDPDPDPESDREPYGVEEEFEPELLPGLTEDGVTDRTALANVHYRTLEGNFRGGYRIVDSGSNETIRVSTQAVTAETTERRIEYDPDYLDSDPETIVEWHTWADGDAEYTRHVNASGGVSYYPEVADSGTEPSLPVSLLELYNATDTVTVEQTADGERYRLEGRAELQRVENASFEVVLAEAGYVERYRVEGEEQWDGEWTTVEYVGEFERLADPDLEEPEWLEEATEGG